MDELIKEVDLTYKMLSSLLVNGDNVDIVAAAKSKLRKISAELGKLNGANKEEVRG